MHRFPAFALLVGHHDPVLVHTGDGATIDAPAVLVPPMVDHQIGECGPVTVVFAQAYSPMRSVLAAGLGTGTVAPIDLETLPEVEWADAQSVADALHAIDPPATGGPGVAVSPVILKVIERLAADPAAVSLRELAEAAGVSPSWLRQLARRELGLPLSAWVPWRKMELAAAALADGCSIAEAAQRGGFADQAHFTRTIRRLLGVAPTEAARSV